MNNPHLKHLNRTRIILASLLAAIAIGAADARAQSSSPTPSASPEPTPALPDWSATANGVTITHYTDESLGLTSSDGDPLTIPVAAPLRFVNNRGAEINPNTIPPKTMIQVIIDGDESSRRITHVLVDLD